MISGGRRLVCVINLQSGMSDSTVEDLFGAAGEYAVLSSQTLASFSIRIIDATCALRTAHPLVSSQVQRDATGCGVAGCCHPSTQDAPTSVRLFTPGYSLFLIFCPRYKTRNRGRHTPGP